MEQSENNCEETDVLTEYYDPVAIVLSGIHHDTGNLTEELRKCAITYDQLSGLVEGDLRLMGMTNDKAIQEVLAEVSQLTKQRRLYDSVICNEYNPIEYAQTVCKNSAEHIHSMTLMLNLMQLKLMLSFPNNLLLEDRIYASAWCLKLCEKINVKLDDVQSVLYGEKKRKPSKWSLRKIGVSLIVLSGAMVVTILCKNHVTKFVR